jgi:hypothetical protein
MNKTEILNKIKSMFFNEDVEVDNSTDWKSGSTIIRVMGEVTVGTEVKEVTEAGLEDLEGGKYEIEDAGITLIIADGKIDSVNETLIPEEMEYKNKKDKMKSKKKFIATAKFDEGVEVEGGELVLVTEEIAVGNEAVVVMDDLSVVETYDGEVIVDGETVVLEAGVITAVEGGEEAPAEEPAEEPVGETNFSNEEKVTELITELRKEITELKGRFETFAGQDADESVTKTKNKKISFENKYDKLKFYGKR